MSIANLTSKILQDLPTHDPGVPAPESTQSFWHQAPVSFLYNHRTTPTLPSTAKTVIIGTGLAGTLCFESLSSTLTPEQLGDVVMLEARSTCWGATGRNGGHCRPALYQYGLFLDYIEAWGEETAIKLARYERINLELMREFGAKYEKAEFTGTDAADVYYETPSWELVKACVAKVTELDAEVGAQLTIVDGATEEGRKELDEGLRVPTAAGAVLHRCGKLWPFRLVEGILGEVVGKGVLNLQCQTPALGLTKAEDGRWIVETERGEIKAERVVVAANAHTGHLLPVLRGWIYPVRAQVRYFNYL